MKLSFNQRFQGLASSELKVIRVVRILRPLRLLHTAKGLQLGINTILKSIFTMVSLFFITIIIFSVMGIFAQGYLKGRYYRCHLGKALRESLAADDVEHAALLKIFKSVATG